MQFLVVDDSPTIRRLVTNSLKQFGFSHFIEAEDGAAAWKLIKEHDIDIVITDWNMPNMNGIELVGKIRNDEDIQNIPVLMLTTRSDKADVVQAIKSKINSYIVKPFKSEELKLKLEPLLRARNNYLSKLLQAQTLKIEVIFDGNTSENIKYIDVSYIHKRDGKIKTKKVSKFTRPDKSAQISKISNDFHFSPDEFVINENILDENDNSFESNEFTFKNKG